MQDFRVNQHARSTHMITFLSWGNLHPGREPIVKTHPNCIYNRIHDWDLEVTLEEIF
jgi:hypothetical protein